ncbi:hypothetical protein BKP45_06680 [Anaerobacillus alkalidiazotrophicus]|uniref:L,D-TPase catalytic domain-containing protein n=1 Tax=Anaerobacillus alkalidiazotrophicus TaxID=472963 RepID=A0A1S2MCC6_9BACI|nr:L,D-transpeptidase [Anaerobacillus alkalidiazotrophicus]OIJ22319.1 hypothetical protein BKP45_06680 [Anaerobacillus alkalidiazotrophicus]
MSRFDSHLKRNLDKIDKNLYVSKNDSHYYEKIIRYNGPNTAEAHFRLAEHYEKEGFLVKAYNHYKEAADVNSPFYIKAKKASQLLENQMNVTSLHYLEDEPTKMTPLFARSTIIFLIIVNLLLLVILFGKASLSAIASTTKKWDTGMDVVYESEDVPYVFYIPIDTPFEEVEKTLFDQAVNLSGNLSNQNIVLYGVLTTDPKLHLQALPLKNEKIRESAFVIAEYNSALDQSVKIRFLNKNFNEAINDLYSANFFSTNLVRTALQIYIEDKGKPPIDVTNLTNDFPNNYLSFIPNETMTKSNQIVSEFSGDGGWVYDQKANKLEAMFYPNTSDFNQDFYQIPFEPVEVIVDKESFTLILQSSPYIMTQKKIGLGKENSTPVGEFTVFDRVIEPKGEIPDIYGTAGLGLGDIAIHGTYDESSISDFKSLGCIRVSNDDMLEIFDFVPKGANVTIVEGSPTPSGYIPISNYIDSARPEDRPNSKQTTDTIFEWLG